MTVRRLHKGRNTDRNRRVKRMEKCWENDTSANKYKNYPKKNINYRQDFHAKEFSDNSTIRGRVPCLPKDAAPIDYLVIN